MRSCLHLRSIDNQPCLDRIENKLDLICMNNLNETEYKTEFNIDSELTTLVKPDNQPAQFSLNIEVFCGPSQKFNFLSSCCYLQKKIS